MKQMEKFLDIHELAVVMNLTADSIRRRISRQAFDVPPNMHFANSKMLRWREAEVKTWLYEHGLDSASAPTNQIDSRSPVGSRKIIPAAR
jgi:predicted DNA-binding transcriptional regulator AlpA